MSLTILVRRCVLVVLLGLVPAYAQAQSLFVSSAQPDVTNHQLVIQGGTYTAGLRIFLGPNFVELPVTSLTAGAIHTGLPDLPPGTHLLVLYHPATNQFTTFPMAIGAVGPAGPAGPSGAAGPTGPTGPTGLTGAIGPQGPIGPTGPQGMSGANGISGGAGKTNSFGSVLLQHCGPTVALSQQILVNAPTKIFASGKGTFAALDSGASLGSMTMWLYDATGAHVASSTTVTAGASGALALLSTAEVLHTEPGSGAPDYVASPGAYSLQLLVYPQYGFNQTGDCNNDPGPVFYEPALSFLRVGVD